MGKINLFTAATLACLLLTCQGDGGVFATPGNAYHHNPRLNANPVYHVPTELHYTQGHGQQGGGQAYHQQPNAQNVPVYHQNVPVYQQQEPQHHPQQGTGHQHSTVHHYAPPGTGIPVLHDINAPLPPLIQHENDAGWSFPLGLCVIVALVYLVTGCYLNNKKGLTGTASIPHKALFISLGSNAKYLVRFLYHWTMTCYEKKRWVGPSQVAYKLLDYAPINTLVKENDV